jgi:hypothetical protein
MRRKFDELQVRKELLMMQAELQRLELGGQVDVLKKEFAWVNVFSQFGRWLGRSKLSSLGSVASFGGQLWQMGLKRHPLLGLLVSTACLKFRKPLAKVVLKAGLSATVLAVCVFWFQERRSSATRPSVSIDPSDP